MQHDYPLTLQHLLGRMRRMFGEATVVTATEGGRERASYTEVADRIDRLCRGLESLGVKQGDRVATFAWNTQRHLEVYLGVPCMGAVLHTLNIRLFADQLAYVVNHAEDSVILVDASLVDQLAKLAPKFDTVRQYVVMGEGDGSCNSWEKKYRYRVAQRVCVSPIAQHVGHPRQATTVRIRSASAAGVTSAAPARAATSPSSPTTPRT